MGHPLRSEESPVAIDCFAGAGGLSLGLMQAGFRIGAAFDHNALAVQTYNRNIGPHALAARIEELSGTALLTAAGLSAGTCSLVAGGPPCQGFSMQRRGCDDDDRNILIMEFLRIVLEIRPAMFLMENVSSIQAKRGQVLLKQLNARAESSGYTVQMEVLDAADFGVPQHRRRMFIVGSLEEMHLDFRFPTPTYEPRSHRTVRQAIGDLPSPLLHPELCSNFHNHQPDKISDLNRIRISHVPPGGGRADIPAELRLPCHRVSVDVAGYRNVYGRLEWGAPAGTITTKCNSFTRGKFAHPQENRNITMREAARLQSFSDDFVFEGSKVDAAHQIGNAVQPLLALQLGTALREALKSRSRLDGRRSRPRQLSMAI
jgi:DNA (cytosine-5)-methyltransferase 1